MKTKRTSRSDQLNWQVYCKTRSAQQHVPWQLRSLLPTIPLAAVKNSDQWCVANTWWWKCASIKLKKMVQGCCCSNEEKEAIKLSLPKDSRTKIDHLNVYSYLAKHEDSQRSSHWSGWHHVLHWNIPPGSATVATAYARRVYSVQVGTSAD